MNCEKQFLLEYIPRGLQAPTAYRELKCDTVVGTRPQVHRATQGPEGQDRERYARTGLIMLMQPMPNQIALSSMSGSHPARQRHSRRYRDSFGRSRATRADFGVD
jgi:hypothetical protein